MARLLSLVRWLPLAVVFAAPSCKDPLPAGDATESNASDEAGTTLLPGTGADTVVAVSSSSSGGTFDGDSGPGPGGGECSLFAQDCNEGEKCVPWSELPDLVPDEIRCCPIQAPLAQPGDLCTVAGYLGSCIDNCVAGSMCFDFDGDGEGVCQRMCAGTEDAPECPNLDDECFIYYSGVPLCFAKCDPLVQDCPSDKGCYPDAIAEGGTGFLCMPTIGNNGLGDYCWLLAACDPGMLCATPDLLPNCFGNATDSGCCTDICDITDVPDTCTDIHPELECVPWFHQGAEPPSAELMNVGACVLPTVGGGA